MQETNEIQSNNHSLSWLSEKRRDAYSTYTTLPVPQKLHDMNVMRDLEKLKINAYPYLENYQQDGITIEMDQLKNYLGKGLVVEPLNIACIIRSQIVKKYLYSKIFAGSKIEALNSALWSRGIFIFIPDGMRVDVPIKIDLSPMHGSLFDRILIVCGKNSKATVFMSSLAGNTSSMPNSATPSLRIEAIELFPEESSELFFISCGSMPDGMHNFSLKHADVAKDAYLAWMDCSVGGSLSYSEVYTDLVGQGAKTDNWGIFHGEKSQRFGVFLRNQHIAANTTSDMLTRGALDDESKSVYNGTIKIVEKAAGSNGYQRQDILLLSSKAGADAKPNLEIDNNEVRCTHGVSIGQLDREKVFYLMSRGLSTLDAKRKIVEGFFETVLRKIGAGAIRQEIESIASSSINEQQNQPEKTK